jgi:hypothetical protein
MAITATRLASGDRGWNTASVTTFTTASITPGTNCLLVLMYGGVIDINGPTEFGSSDTVTSSGSGPSWTNRANPAAAGGNFQSSATCWSATIGGSDPGSFTVTIDPPSADPIGCLGYAIYKITGHDTSTPFGGKVATQNQAGNGAVTATLDAAPASGDVTLALSVVDTDASGTGATFGSSFGTWTEDAEGAGTNDVGWNVGQRTGSTSTSVEWTDVNTGSATTFSSAQTAIVIKVAAGGGGDGTATPAVIGLAATVPAATGLGDLLPFVVTSNVAALTTDDPSVTFSGYTPLEDDLVILFPSSTTVLGAVANASLPAGWVNPLGDGVEVNSDSHGLACFYHLVTAGEESGGTTTYTATNALDAAETGRVHGVVVRNVDPSAPIDGFNTAFNSGNTTTPHVLAGITGSGVLLDGSLVVSSVAADGTGTYGSVPAGWTQLQTAGTTQGRWTGTRDTLTTVNTDVTATNITPSAGDEYCSITLAVAKAIAVTHGTATPAVTPLAVTVPAASAGGFATVTPAVIAVAVAVPAPTLVFGFTVTPAVIPLAVAIPAATATGSTSGTGTPAVIARAVALPAVTTQAGSRGSPAVIARAVIIPAVTGSGSKTVLPAVIPLAVVFDTANVDSSAGVDVIPLAATIPQATATGGGSATALPAVIARAVVMPAATPTFGSTLAPAVIACTVVLPAATTQGGASTSPSVIASVIVLPAPTLQAGSVPTPAVIALAAVVPQATGTGASPGTGVPAVIALATTLPAPTATGAGNTTPAVIALAVTIPQAAASGASPGTAVPAVTALAVALPAPTTQYGWTATPTVTALTVTVPAATGQASKTTTPAVIALAVAIPAAAATGGTSTTTTPAAIVVAVTIPTPTLLYGSTLAPAVIALAVVMPSIVPPFVLGTATSVYVSAAAGSVVELVDSAGSVLVGAGATSTVTP